MISKTKEGLKSDLESMAKRMIEYCSNNGLIINSGKTQLLVSWNGEFKVQVGDSIITAESEISLLGIDYDKNFSTAPYLRRLATEANTKAAVIYRLSFTVPPHLLKLLAKPSDRQNCSSSSCNNSI